MTLFVDRADVQSLLLEVVETRFAQGQSSVPGSR